MENEFYHAALGTITDFLAEQKAGKATMEEFRQYLNQKHFLSQSPLRLSSKRESELSDNDLAKQLILLSRFSKQMLRKALKEFPALQNEEFTYLYRLKDEPLLSKSELIERNGHEKQTGTEIIRRLARSGLIEECTDYKDRRVRRLRLSPKGESEFAQSFSQVSKAARLMVAVLETEEKQAFLKQLKKLNTFHFTLYTSMRKNDFDSIVKKIAL